MLSRAQLSVSQFDWHGNWRIRMIVFFLWFGLIKFGVFIKLHDSLREKNLILRGCKLRSFRMWMKVKARFKNNFIFKLSPIFCVKCEWISLIFNRLPDALEKDDAKRRWRIKTDWKYTAVTRGKNGMTGPGRRVARRKKIWRLPSFDCILSKSDPDPN